MKKILMTLLILLVATIIGAAIGFLAAPYVSPDMTLWDLILLLMFTLIAELLHIAVHEAGHLLMGLLTGYRFVSYRLFSWLIIRKAGKLTLTRYSLPGTMGQCLMAPPAYSDKLPYILYNLGGGLANLLLALAAYGLMAAGWLPFSIALPLTGIGLFFGLMNLIPLKGFINNDGYNILSIAREKDARFYWWAMLQIHADMAEGLDLKDLPPAYFPQPDPDKLANPIILAGAANFYNYLLALDRLDAAKDYLRQLLDNSQVPPGYYRLLLTCDYGFFQLLYGEAFEVKLTERDWKVVAAIRKSQPSALRFSYAYARLVEKDSQKARQYLTDFETLMASYPYPSEAKTETRLLEMLTAREEEKDGELADTLQ